MKSLPIGIQSIRDIIEQGFAYVDKTAILYGLIKKKGVYFLSRPRRFGKSLTCSTLEAIFQGKKELFHGLDIANTDYDWKEYPVIRLDFSDIIHTTMQALEESLKLEFARIAQRYGTDLSTASSTGEQFKDIILQVAAKHGPVVIIIDEYDKPIIDHIGNPELALQMRSFMKSLYGILKGAHVEANLRFLLMTGVSKFSKVSVFSELNNLNDLTLDRQAATLCGYTQQELELVFAQHIENFASHANITKDALLEKLQYWYDGFKFSKSGARVYNPFSILNCLDKKDFTNYWFASGTPSFMMHFVQKNPAVTQQIMTLETEQLTIAQMDKLSLETYFDNMVLIFLQAGYLTIASYDDATRLYNLSYPNFEVRLSMTEQIFELIAHINAPKVASMEYRLKKALQEDDIQGFCHGMRDFFALLPHTVVIEREKFYQGVFFTVAKLIGARIDAEQATSRGFIDAVLEGHKNTYVIEFKKDKTPAIALKQIQTKEYDTKFGIEGTKPVVLVGINFDYSPDTGVTLDWLVQDECSLKKSHV